MVSMKQPAPKPAPPATRTPEENLRATVNNAAVSVVSQGFDALDQLAEIGKDRLKRAILRGIIGPGRKIF